MTKRLLFLFALCSPALAQTGNLWVGAAGTCTRVGSPATYNATTSCGSMQAAQTAASGGDTVMVLNGTYAAQTLSTGTKASTVNYQAQTNGSVLLADLTINIDKVHITGIIGSGSGTNRGGLDIEDLTSTAFTDVVVSCGNTMTSWSGWGWKNFFAAGSHITVQGCDFGGWNACDGYNGSGCTAGSNCEIEDGTRFWSWGPGSTLQPDSDSLLGDIVHDVIAPPDGACGGGAGVPHVDAMQIFSGGTNITISGNKFYGNATSAVQAGGGTLSNWTLENNYFGETTCCNNLVWGQATVSGSYIVRNNTNANPNGYMVVNNASASGAATYDFSSNLNIAAATVCTAVGSVSGAFNVFPASGGTTCGTNTKRCNPVFLNGTPASGNGYDVRLSPSDTCAKGAGNSSDFASTDIFGTTRAAPITTGAFAFSSIPAVATPTASPVAGTYTGSQTITLSTITGGATICYTTDGTTPTANGAGSCTHGTTYAAPFTVTLGTTVVEAIGSLSGDTDSSVFSATYIILAQTLTKIVILPPTTGYYLATNTSTAQLAPQCFDTTATVMACPSLTWYSSDTPNATVSGTGLVTGTGSASVTTGVYITAYAPSKSATVTAYAIASNAITVTGTNTFAVNDPVTLAGFSTSTFLNNQTVIVTAATGSTFTAQFIHSNTSVTESGNAKLFVLGRGGVLMPTYTPSGLVTSVGDQVVVGSRVLVSARDSTSRPLGDFCAWTSSDPTKATVNYIGEVTGVAVGSVTMTCTIGANTSTGTFNVTNPTSTSTTWYVRPGGGTRWDAAVTSGQCNGKFDVDYPGSGTNQNCAFNQVMYLFTDETSSSVCTPAPGPGDTAIVRGGPYYINRRQNGTQWVGCQNGTIAPPNGPTGQPFRLLGENWASPTVGRNNPGNATKLISPASVAPPFSIGEQNIDIESFDINLQQDCNPGLNNLSFACPSGNNHPFIFISNNFASNITIKNVRGHGATTFWTGVPGLNVQFINTFSEYNFLDGYNFDDPFGDSQYRTDGFTGIGIEAYCAGCTEEQPKPVTSVSRSGGNITVVFPSTSVVNYVAPTGGNPGTNLVLTGMTPSDLNGTFPVNTVIFNQQTVTITGGSVIADPDGSVPFLGTYTTSTPPTFRIGDFVNITGLSPSFVNGTYEVSNVLSNEFQIWVSPVSRPGWTTATITGTGSASTAVTVVATAAGSTENATVVGTAGHVFQNHRMFDQFTGAFANGDCIGSGANTIGDWLFNGFYFQNCLQDGLDDLHGSVHSVTVLNGYVEGAEGAPVKLGNADFVTMKGNVLVSNGAKLIAFDPNLAPDANQYVSTTYRSGDVFVMSSHPWSREIISNNSWISGGFNVVWDDFCTQAIGCATPLAGGYYIAQNNIFRGFTDTNNSVWNSSLPTVYFAEGGNVPWLFQYNMSSSTRNPPSGGTGNQWSTDPLIVTPIPNITTFAGELNALSNNLNLTGSSPAIGAGLQNFGVPTSDNVGTAMPNPPPIGALNPAGTVTPTAQFFGTGKFFGQQTIP